MRCHHERATKPRLPIGMCAAYGVHPVCRVLCAVSRMRATGWVRKETAAARRTTVRVTAASTMAGGGNYGVALRFIVDGQPSRMGERLVINATIEETREIIARLTEALEDVEHYRDIGLAGRPNVSIH